MILRLTWRFSPGCERSIEVLVTIFAVSQMINGSSYYRILGVSRDATADQIKAAYRQLAQIYHPDSAYFRDLVSKEISPQEIEDFFKQLTIGYDILMDADKRRRYDRELPPNVRGWESKDLPEISPASADPSRDERLKLHVRAMAKAEGDLPPSVADMMKSRGIISSVLRRFKAR